jgi:hypothetical protein
MAEVFGILEWYFSRFWEAVNLCYFFTSNVFFNNSVCFSYYFLFCYAGMLRLIQCLFYERVVSLHRH